MPLRLISGMLRSSGNDAMLIMDTGMLNQFVLVTKQALLDVASPPRCDESRLQQHIQIFSNIASDKYDRGEVKPDGRVWITSDDIAKWKQLH
ncbi:hypothetical protein QD460_25585 [Rhizobium jaguaris]|uniref:Uncharacterized protein n=1 Tax=Rhizobium jaguaris TaxID=1312183 RepID=A0A387G198_9HYPH|nr:hypothetical protein [Rhizobium jaguaris]AYG63607.1 hypothetical protein CCGE525_33790 [Rhizobium jaguaris]